jgi:hypothetical protein
VEGRDSPHGKTASSQGLNDVLILHFVDPPDTVGIGKERFD